MKRFKNIAIVYKCDPTVLERAAILAKENLARLTIVHVIKDIPASYDHLRVDDKPVDVRNLVLKDQQEHLEGVASSVHSIGVYPKSRLLVGEPFIEIIRDVIENHRDLVIMTADKKTGWKEFFFGSTASSLMRDCPCPVLALKPSERKGFKKILVAVDPVLVGDSHDTLNRVILELASSLAELEGAELHIVHAWRLIGESMMRGHPFIPSSEIDFAVHEEFEKHRKLFEIMIEKHSVGRHHDHLIKGDAATAVLALVKDLGVDMLVMGTVCRTGIPGFVIGNTAEQLIAAVDCSVLIVKPEGFVSPIATQIAANPNET